MDSFGLQYALPKLCGSDDAVTEPSSHLQAALTKKTLRNHLLTQRKALSVNEWRFKSDAICQNLAQFEWVQNAQTILVYLSHRQEPDLSLLWTHYFPHKRWGIPRCVEKNLVWHECNLTDSSQLQSGAYGILEPLPTSPVIEASTVDLILVPAVGCDRQGFRLGYGGGFYDRLFSNSSWAKVPTIGVIFEFAYLDRLIRDPWDYPLRGVCTELNVNIM
jgi:5-formyltetrahydrofolate cyclo-ligase